MQRRNACLLVVCIATLIATVCSGGSDDTADAPKASPCPLIERLDDTAATVARADVSDPDTFDRTLRRAVERYVETVRQLRKVAPEELQGDLERMEAAVDQYRFQDAAEARAALDSYAATNCAPPAPTTTTVPTTGPTSTTQS